MTTTLLTLLAAYLLGSLSAAVLLSRAFGLPDPRSYGSGNPGATNVLRTGNKKIAALTLLGDGIKGALAVWLAMAMGTQFSTQSWLPALAGLAAFVGHLWPVFFGFKGGKGVATALGVLLALNPLLGLATLLTWLAIFALTRISSLSALVASAAAPFFAAGLDEPGLGALVILVILIFWRHRTNIQRLIRGEEGGFRKS
ncbi:MAG: glycerol-3-phosphate 1-O-acyltransferase PlsY [Betaproteobacteria bacterium]|nr:glycerol-3-phosphate 1-O-acyltransferase PlsY [Betaproteobacteria bacterium]